MGGLLDSRGGPEDQLLRLGLLCSSPLKLARNF